MTAHVKVNGAWKNVPELFTNVNGASKTVSESYSKVDGIWNRSYASLIESATGGTIDTVGGYRRHVFNSSGTFTITSGTGPLIVITVNGGTPAQAGYFGQTPQWYAIFSYGGRAGVGGKAVASFYESVSPRSATVTVGASNGTSSVGLPGFASQITTFSGPDAFSGAQGAYAYAVWNSGSGGSDAGSYENQQSLDYWPIYSRSNLGYSWGQIPSASPAVWPTNPFSLPNVRSAFPGFGGGGGAFAREGYNGYSSLRQSRSGTFFGGASGGFVGYDGTAGSGGSGGANTGGGGGGGVASGYGEATGLVNFQASSGGAGGSGKVIIMYPIQEFKHTI